ncbi:MAG: hypothetical protein NC300_03305 [Bacteroidales bacterium]|nr:hypothetical protein [Clostridium sp.]MCM1203146.1 hypothetical protein [Bacteroidales bacterium]
MKREDKKVIKDIVKHQDLERNLPAYGSAYVHTAYAYNLIRLVLNYYTMKEVWEEGGQAAGDDFLVEVMDEIHTLIFKTVLSEELQEDCQEAVLAVNKIREEMTGKMTVLTAYTDALQIYEYVLNRVEYGITKEQYPVEESQLAAKVFQYLFADNDKMVINSKIQMVTGQLPVRMTKNRFFEYLSDTLNIYNGSDKSAVDDFVSMLESTALLTLPKGYEEDYPEIYRVIKLLKETDYKQLDLEAYQGIMEQFSFTTAMLTELVSNYLLAMELINDLYAVLLACPYQKDEEEGVAACISMLRGIHDAFISESKIPEFVDDGFMNIEGLQEELGEDMLKFESVLFDIMREHEDTISWMMSDKLFHSLELISKLSSNSLFIDLDKQEESDAADGKYIAEKLRMLTAALTAAFEENPKEINRAVMAALFSQMPVLFNSQEEIKDYIEYSLNHCGNESELMACAKLLDELMQEE